MTQDNPTFVAIDFETADYGADSACAVALVRVENWQIVRQETRLIRPPRRYFHFTYLHGISWLNVKDEPPFGEVWKGLTEVLTGAKFLAAHNAGFDRSVLQSCCSNSGMEMPKLPFHCSMTLARKTWQIFPATLSDVCRYLGIPLNHHDPASDAEAAAKIVIAANQCPGRPRNFGTSLDRRAQA